MDNIIVLNQHVKLYSLEKLKKLIKPRSMTLILSTQFLFENEVEIINNIFDCKCIYKTFSDILSDAELEQCDRDAFNPESQKQDVMAYYEDIKKLKNKRIVDKILLNDSYQNKIIVGDGLGICLEEWIDKDFTFIELDYYYKEPHKEQKNRPLWRKMMRRPFHLYLKLSKALNTPIHEAYSGNQRYLFYGKLDRIGYRINLVFNKAGFIEHIIFFLNMLGLVWKNNTIRLSSFHEGYHLIPDYKELNVKLIQDGYLPPNYSSNYLFFYGKNTEFYTWDKIGCDALKYHNLPHKIMPFRKKFYLPVTINFPPKINKVLCAASGSGDWTALKNRSDDDKLVWAIGKIAKKYPDIEFIYRCHPTWVHPMHVGVNSISRCAEYISWLNLPNFKLSSNIPNAFNNVKFIVSYKRSSFEDDLRDADIVIGEHSIAMIDGCFQSRVFASCNMTGRRDLFEGISKFGFPHCENIEQLEIFLDSIHKTDFQDKFMKAISNYNQMTDIF